MIAHKFFGGRRFVRPLFFRKENGEGRTLHPGALGGEPAAVPLHDFPANGQSHAAAFILRAPVQPFERFEDAFQVGLVETDAIVDHRDLAEPVPPRPMLDRHHRRHPFPVELEGVADQVLEQLVHLQGIGVHRRQVPRIHPAVRARDAGFQERQHVLHHLLQAGGLKRPALGGDLRELEQVVDELLHPLRRPFHAFEIVLGAFAQVLAEIFLQPLAEGDHLAQRLLQVVRGDGGEVPQVLVAALQLLRVQLELFLESLAFLNLLVQAGVDLGQLPGAFLDAPFQVAVSLLQVRGTFRTPGQFRKNHDRPPPGLVFPDGEAPAFDRQAAAVLPPEQVLRNVPHLTVLQGPVNRAVLQGIGRSIGPGVVDPAVLKLAGQLLRRIAQHPGARRVDERDPAFRIEAANALRRGFQDQVVGNSRGRPRRRRERRLVRPAPIFCLSDLFGRRLEGRFPVGGRAFGCRP